MATLKQIQFKRSKTAGARPAASVLAEGELAINLKDRTIFTKDDSGNIIDLGIAKGGQIDGNVTIDGTLRVNGPINNFGNFSTSGTITASNIVSATVFRSTSGSFYTRAINDTANAHLWFENTNGSERGVLYSKPQSENEGVITMRVRQGTAAGAQNSEFHFISTDGGIFQARKLTALTSISTPTISVNLINHDSKAFGQYDSQSLVQYVYPGTGETNGVNYLRKVRAKSGGTMWHELCTAQTGQADEMSWWTGNTPQSKQYGIRNDGRMAGRNSLALGTFTTNFPSSDYGNVGVMGDKYLVLGDTVTGLSYKKTGVFDLVGGGYSVASITPDGFRSTRKGIFGRSEDQGTTWIMPGTNAAFLSVQTQADNNNAGDGQTHIGYNAGGKMSHYFRGKGKTNINTQEGVDVNPGILKLTTGGESISFNAATGSINSTLAFRLNKGIIIDGPDNQGFQFNAPTAADGTRSIYWNSGTRAGQNKSPVTVKVWGNSFNTSGDRARETVFEVADGQGYHFYSQRVAPAPGSTVGPIQLRVNGGLLTSGSIVTSGSITTESSLVANNGLSVNGQAKFGGTANALRIWNAEYGAIFRRSESNFYIIPTNQNEGESGDIHSSLRPVRIGLNDGMVGLGRDSFIVDQNNALTTINSNSRINANFRMQLGQNAYIDIEASDGVRPTGCGSFASQNDVNVRAPIYMNIERTATSEYIPIVKQRYVKGDSTYSIGTLISQGDFRVHYHQGTSTTGTDLSWEFRRTGDFRAAGKIIAGAATLGTDGNITGGSGNFANLNTTLNRKVNSGFVTYGATAGWYKFATVTMPQSTSTVFFKIAGGSGFNSGLFTQCNIAEIVLRTSNERPADLNAVLYTRTSGLYSAAFRNIAVNNVSGNTYDIYVYAGTYCNQLACEWSCTENATVSVIGINSSTQSPIDALPDTAVNGQVANVLNNLVDRGKAKRYVAESEIAINNQTGLRITSNSDRSGSNSVLFRNDGGSFYILLTDKNSSDGDNKATEGDWNGKRPFSIDMTAGTVRLGENTSFDKDITINGNINSRVKAAGQWSVSFSAISDVTRDNSAFLANTGGISKTSQAYYPLFSGYSFLTDAGYLQSFEFGWLGVSGTWRQGIIRMRGDNPSGQQARWTFDMDGTFYAPILSCGSARAFGVNTSNGLGGNSITFGDSDTGIKQNGDGLLDIYANNVQVFRFQNGDLYSYKNINAPNVYIRSDIRLKSNFKPIENALDKVEKLNGVIYDKAEYIGGEAIETEAGIVAQTLQDVLPEAVRETEDSKGNKILTVSSQAQIALLVEAVKTLSSRVKELESKLM
ncbi:long tail fiber protein distal subunit [Shigella phage Shfl2]|uniref:Long tail fiber protein Gp37 n=1 Tax=Shigella phage Shfl2 TaxID=1002725 RepID=F2VXI3_9CAUD|nr:long tail fiber protein distal subunit [Shigella phage Shfl2]AEA73201.1 putative long tail fiber protein [Shigella phage Shfl2]